MKLREYLKHLETLVKENKSVLDYEVIYAIDDEGNGFKKNNYEPSLWKFSEDECDATRECEENEINSVCVN